MNSLRISALTLALLLSAGCLHVETGRQVIVDLGLQEIAIVKRERVLALLTVEGPFPKSNETAYIIPSMELTGRGRAQLGSRAGPLLS